MTNKPPLLKGGTTEGGGGIHMEANLWQNIQKKLE